MSYTAGSMAQMPYHNAFNNLGVQGPGFSTHRKNNPVKRLNGSIPARISTIDETQVADGISTPRTARGHMLAGLRTAPKSATVSQAHGLENSKYASPYYNDGVNAGRVPQTATGAYFAHRDQAFNQDYLASPEQVLAPPALDFAHDSAGNMDQSLIDELVATNNYLAQQQRALQQQLLSVQAAASQLGGLNINGYHHHHHQGMQAANPATTMGLYNQQFQPGLQPVVQPVVGQPGMFAVYNPMTGQSSFVYDNTVQTQAASPVVVSPVQSAQRGGGASPQSLASPPVPGRSISPPKPAASPVNVEPLPPPSANAFRRGHRKGLSSVNVKSAETWTRSTVNGGKAVAGIPATPMTGTFGPGQARIGEHPIRQPRNPPHLSELQEKPTAKHEGSKNFAARQRRRAVLDLVKAGRERLSNSESGSPGSDKEFNFSVGSEPDEDSSGQSGNLSSKPSSGSLAAIGSERKEKSRERTSVDSNNSSIGIKSLSSDEGKTVGGSLIEVAPDAARRKAPLLVLSSAEKRRSVAY